MLLSLVPVLLIWVWVHLHSLPRSAHLLACLCFALLALYAVLKWQACLLIYRDVLPLSNLLELTAPCC